MVVGSLYDALFNMLRKQRFDCFLRSVIEIEEELKQHPELAIEPHLVFRYPLALLFFVSPSTRNWPSASSSACSEPVSPVTMSGYSRRVLAAPSGGCSSIGG